MTKQQNERFYRWVEAERIKRGLSYAALAKKMGRGSQKSSGIFLAIKNGSNVTLDHVTMIAKAFDMTRLQVLREVDYIELRPEDLENASLEAVELWEIVRKLPVQKQRDMIRMARSLLDDGG